jgi:hypothetical protein
MERNVRIVFLRSLLELQSDDITNDGGTLVFCFVAARFPLGVDMIQ